MRRSVHFFLTPLACGSLRASLAGPFGARDGLGLVLFVAGLVGALAGCTGPAGGPRGSAFERGTGFAAVVPDVADHTAADVARAALLSRPDEAQQAVERLRAIDTVLAADGDRPTGLVPVARDVANAALDDPRAYRAATGDLLERDDLDPALRARLEMEQADDPLLLARQRLHEDWVLEFARAFNRIAEPLGTSVTSFAAAPYRLASSALSYALELHAREPLPLRQRQALAHWKTFLAHNPDAPEAQEIEPRVEDAEWRLQRTWHERELAMAERSLEAGDSRLAFVHADRALRAEPEDADAIGLRAEAMQQLLAERRESERSVASESDLDPAADASEQRELAVALLTSRGAPQDLAHATDSGAGSGALDDERRFAHALALGQAGQEDAMWSELEDLASADPESSNMARHAAALIASPAANPHGAFVATRSAQRWRTAREVVLGPFSEGPRDRGLWRPFEWLVDLPQMAETLTSLPLRLLELPWKPTDDGQRAVASQARAYLARRPEGEHAEETRGWLEDYESGRGNWLGALPLATQRTDASADEIAELREKAARQWLDGAERERDLALRNGMYRELARDLPETAAAREAGRRARNEAEQTTPQYVRLSRGFLEENPQLAGPECLDLRPELLDRDPANGELHPQGVVLLGGDGIEVNYVARSGDPDDAPRPVRERLAPDEMARIVSALEETSFRNSLLDADDAIVADADRDAFFERLRLGLAEEPDARPSARSSYAYRGLRERYGMVRSRESILPFDLVLQGSLTDLRLGAFPRIRVPRETPDSFLYR